MLGNRPASNNLGKITSLNTEIARIKKNKWELEEKIIKLEEKLSALEKKCPKKYVRDESKKQLDFTDVKIPELDARIKFLTKNLPKTDPELSEIKNTLNTYKTEYEKTLADLGPACARLDLLNKAMREGRLQLHSIRDEVKVINDRKAMINQILEFDGILSLPILIMILQEIKQFNEADIFESLLQATGKDLRKETKETNFEVICANYLKVDIKGAFEAFTKNADTKNVDENAVKSQMQKLITDIWAALQKNLRLNSKILSDKAFNDFCGFLRTEIYLTCVLETYRFTDDVQMNVGVKQKKFALWMNLREVLNPYVAINQAAKQVQITPKTEALFREAAIWLKGLYQRSYSQVPQFLKDADGKVTEIGFSYIGDQEERDLYKWKPPLTKIRMADNHKYHGDVLLAKLPQEQAQLQAEAKEAATNQTQIEPIEPLSNLLPGLRIKKPDDKRPDERPRLPSEPASLLHPPQEGFQPVLIVKDQDHYQMTISLHKDEQEKLHRLSVKVGKVMRCGVVAAESELGKELMLYQSFSPEEKINKLRDCICKYQLTSNQSSSLKFIRVTVNDTFQGYADSSRYWFFSRANAEDARNVIMKINGAANPREQLDALFSLRKILMNNNSASLRRILDKILLDTYNILSSGQEGPEQASKPVSKEQNGAANVLPVQINEKHDHLQMIVTLHKDEVEKLNKLEVAVGKIMEHGVVVNELQMSKELMECQSGSPEEKIVKLKDCINKFMLNTYQSSSLKFLKGEINYSFKPYIEGSVMKVFSHYHSEDAKRAIDEIVTTDDARVHLKKLFALRKKLKKDNSQNLLKIIDTLLLKAYDVLISGAKPEIASRPNNQPM